MYYKIKLEKNIRDTDFLVIKRGEEVKFTDISQKELYEEALLQIETHHHSEVKWTQKLDTHIPWEDVWGAVHTNIVATNQVKNNVWKQTLFQSSK